MPRSADTIGSIDAGPVTLESAINPQSMDGVQLAWPASSCNASMKHIAGEEPNAQRSLMHRWVSSIANIADTLY